MGQLINLIGKRFGRWTVIDKGGYGANGKLKWKCICDCGTIKEVYGQSLRNGSSTSCGCYSHEFKTNNYKDITGKRFGHLVVLQIDEEKTNAKEGVYWQCKCDCGNNITVYGVSLRNGNTQSCGCLVREVLNKIDRTRINHKIHGGTDKYGKAERLYSVWRGMKSRCNNPNNDAYRYYGGRGIKICDEWQNNYGSFRQWAMANGYDPNAKHGDCTIDRIDNDGNYEPSNCRFVDMKTQNQNQRTRGTC